MISYNEAKKIAISDNKGSEFTLIRAAWEVQDKYLFEFWNGKDADYGEGDGLPCFVMKENGAVGNYSVDDYFSEEWKNKTLIEGEAKEGD